MESNKKISKKELKKKLAKTKLKKEYNYISNNLGEYLRDTPIPTIKGNLDELDAAYYIGEPFVNDAVYDQISDYYYSNVKASKSEKTGSKVSMNKVTLPHYMGSMDKLKPGQSALTSFLGKYKESKVISEKLDGNSLLIGRTSLGKFIAYTRGNGTIGQDVSHILPYINTKNGTLLESLEKLHINTYIRGELIISKENWKINSHLGTAARNVVAGIIHRKTYTPDEYQIIQDMLDFVAYEWLEETNTMTPEEMFIRMNEIGFDIAHHQVVSNAECSESFLETVLSLFRQESQYEIDGIIVANNVVYQPVTSKNPKHAKAFKMEEFNEGAITIVRDIEWLITKESKLKPTFIIDKTLIGNAYISRAFGYNARYVLDNKIGIGSTVEVLRSGDVIPKVKTVVSSKFNISTDFPQEVWKWDDKQVDIISVNPDTEELSLRQIQHFIKTLEIEFVGPGIIKKLYDVGLISIVDYIQLSSKKILLKAEGIKDKSADRIFKSITEKLSSATLDLFSASLPCFEGLGRRKMKIVIDNYPDFYTKSKSELFTSIPHLELFADESTRKLIDGIDCLKDYLEIYFGVGYTFEEPTNKSNLCLAKKDLPLYGKGYCFSGVRSKETEELLTGLGAEIHKSVSNKVTTLVVADVKKTSSKVTEAIKKGIEIISLDSLITELGK